MNFGIFNKEKNNFPKEQILDGYYPSELILVKEKGKYRFAVHYYPGVDAVKVLHNDKDYLCEDVEFADFLMTDPNNMSPLSHGDKNLPFKTHFVRDFSFCKLAEDGKSVNDFSFVLAPICDQMMSFQDEAQAQRVSPRMNLSDILCLENKINKKLDKMSNKDFEK